MSRAELTEILLLVCAIACADLTEAASMKKDLSRVNANKSLDLVSVLQENLRKNNDDYKDIREPTNTKMKNPYLNEDMVTSEPEAKDGKGLDYARRNLENNPKPQDTKKPLITNPTSTPKTTKLQDKLMLHDKAAKNYDKLTTLKPQDKALKTENKNNNNESFKTLRKDIPMNNKELMLRDEKKRKDDFETWKPNAEKVDDKNAMLHDKQMKAINNKLKLQDTKSIDKKPKALVRIPVSRQTMDWMKVSSEEEFFGFENKKVTKNLKSESGFVTMTATSPDARRKRPKYDQLHQLLDKEGLLKKFLRRGTGFERGGERGVERQDTRNRAFEIESGPEPPPVAETVPSEELDMLPATGERIETLKRKGRFCFRHVLFPEGPKYDSRGRVYEPAHAVKLGHRNFAHTRRPKQVLPKCCNCCKKSVLGCE